MNDISLLPGERLDDLQNGLFIIQHPDQFPFGTDAVLLSHFVRAKPSDHVIDLGTGTGIIPLLLSVYTKCAHITGLELQLAAVDMAQRSVAFNGLQDRINILQGDIREVPNGIPACRPFDVVTCNPPYQPLESGTYNTNTTIRNARHELTCTLDDVAAAACRLLRYRGRFVMIHQAQRLADVFSTLARYQLMPKRICMVHPKPDRPPALFLLEAMLHGHSGLLWSPPLFTRNPDGTLSDAMRKIYSGTYIY